MENGENKGGKAKKALNIILNVLAGVFFIICMFALIASVAADRSDGAVNVFGRQMRVVISPSMEKCDKTDVSQYKIKDIPLRSMVFIELVPEEKTQAEEWYSNLAVGDVLTFRYYYANSQMTVTHRIVSVTPNADGAGYTIELQGDNLYADDPTGGSGVLTQTINTATDTRDTFKYVIGKVTGKSVVLGYIIYIVSQPVGMSLIIIVPCAVIMVLQIIRIVNVLTEEKREKLKAEQRKKDDELEELRKKLAAFEAAAPLKEGKEGQPDGGEAADE